MMTVHLCLWRSFYFFVHWIIEICETISTQYLPHLRMPHEIWLQDIHCFLLLIWCLFLFYFVPIFYLWCQTTAAIHDSFRLFIGLFVKFCQWFCHQHSLHWFFHLIYTSWCLHLNVLCYRDVPPAKNWVLLLVAQLLNAR